MRLLLPCLILPWLWACSDDPGTDPGPDPVPASIRVDAISYLGEFGDGDYEDSTELSVGNRTAWILVLTRTAPDGGFARTDSVHVADLKS